MAPRAVAPKLITAALSAAAVVPAEPEQRERVQDRAVAGQLVVLVEHVDAESPSRVQWFIASNAISVTRRSMASWAIPRSCTQCGQPQTTWPGRSVSRSAASGLGSSITSHWAKSSSRERRPPTSGAISSSEEPS